MNFFENCKMAFECIKGNKMRSFLTMLGIIIGISSVIAIVAIGQGARIAIIGQFEKIGAFAVEIKVKSSGDKSDYFTVKDVEKIKEVLQDVKYISPLYQKMGKISSDIKSKRAYISGGNEELAYIDNEEIIYGRYFSNKEYLEGKAVGVLNEEAAKSLFGYPNVVGKTVKLGNDSITKKVTIIGVKKGISGILRGRDNDELPAFVSIPVTLMGELYPYRFAIGNIKIAASSKEETENVSKAAIDVLEVRHNNKGKEIYSAESIMKQLEQVNRVLSIFTTFVGAVAGISLIVGGIGVMNIMLVSVTERTREIGIRKALGATTSMILIQFLTESVIISVIGGTIGMITGIVGAELIGNVAGITPELSTKVIIGTILFSSIIGIFFGIYPAKKAASLNPIDALRYE
ncbi:ABC transporter permease [Clostridium ganghwense]|uniref:ABC transporter permease n=1 Tax=Clostridium ganghwense TaxID=312089 RepID=A0ABT4CRX7_9CLOT|nr:ABC transporter permease [Clostridium ganghwense]MCY6370739.1 ABC transporter permease [Clostridium ganghwense]